MNITLIHPSRGRPQKALDTLNYWLSHSGQAFEYILSIDESDPEKETYKTFFKDCQIVCSNNSSVVEATNMAARQAKGDILIYLSDDFKCPDNWGPLVVKEFEDRPLLVKVDDCLQQFDVAVLTIPIMNRMLYEWLGYFWHPGYKSMFCDEDLYWTTKKLGALKMAPHLKFPHEHHKDGDDETYRRSAKNWDQGKEFFRQRRGAGFP